MVSGVAVFFFFRTNRIPVLEGILSLQSNAHKFKCFSGVVSTGSAENELGWPYIPNQKQVVPYRWLLLVGVRPFLMDHSVHQKEISIQICYKVSWLSSFLSIWGKDTEPEYLDEFGMYVGIFRGRIGHHSSSFPLCISLSSQNRWVGQTTRWL